MILLVKGRPFGSERVKKLSLNPFTPKSDLIDFTLSNARRFYSSKGDPLGVKGLSMIKFRAYGVMHNKIKIKLKYLHGRSPKSYFISYTFEVC